jgi:glycosyltransferase involved in cell wall biosynthesis
MKVSVSVITYNHAPFIAQALESILMQKTDFDLEILVGEDQSYDGTREIVKQFEQKYPDKIKAFYHNYSEEYIRIDGRKNIKNNLQHASGEYIAFLEGDDFWIDPFKLQKQVDLLDTYPDYGLVHSNCMILYQDTGKMVLANSRDKKIPRGEVYEELLVKNFIKTCTILGRSELIKKYSDYDLFTQKKFKMGDYPTWLGIARQAKISYIHEPLATYRVRKNTSSRPDQPQKQLNFINSIYTVKQYFINRYGCKEETKKKVEEMYLKRKLIFAVKSHDPLLARDSYLQLKKIKKINIANRLKYTFYFIISKSLMKPLSRFIIKLL